MRRTDDTQRQYFTALQSLFLSLYLSPDSFARVQSYLSDRSIKVVLITVVDHTEDAASVLWAEES